MDGRVVALRDHIGSDHRFELRTLQLRYAIKSTTTEALLALQLDLTVKTGPRQKGDPINPALVQGRRNPPDEVGSAMAAIAETSGPERRLMHLRSAQK